MEQETFIASGMAVTAEENQALAGKTTNMSKPVGGMVFSFVLTGIALGWTAREFSHDRVGKLALTSVSAAFLSSICVPLAEVLEKTRPNWTITIKAFEIRNFPVYRIVGAVGVGAGVLAGVLASYLYLSDLEEGISDHKSGLYYASAIYGGSLGGIPILMMIFRMPLSFIGGLYLAIAMVVIGLILQALRENDIQKFLRRIRDYGIPEDLAPFADLNAQKDAFEAFLTQGEQ